MSRFIRGYAALFDRVDLAGDEIAPGAFLASLNNDALPLMLYQHDAHRPIGRWTTAHETETGLWVEGRLAEDVQAADEAAALVAQRVLTGLSIGFRTQRAAAGQGRTKRRLLQLDLVEISLVTFPMQPLARLSRGGDAPDHLLSDLQQAGQRLFHLSRN